MTYQKFIAKAPIDKGAEMIRVSYFNRNYKKYFNFDFDDQKTAFAFFNFSRKCPEREQVTITFRRYA